MVVDATPVHAIMTPMASTSVLKFVITKGQLNF